MSEQGEGPEIIPAGGSWSPETIKRTAEATKVKGYGPIRPGGEKEQIPRIEIDTGPLADQVKELIKGQEGLLATFEAQRLSTEQLLGLSQKQSDELVRSLQKLPTSQERARWVDVEYNRLFYTRFTPNIEPRFYTEISDPEERALWDARWQLARAAYFKLATTAFPDKYVENADIQLLSNEQLGRLYKMPGVKPMLKAYAEAIVGKRKVVVEKDGEDETITIWDCKSMADFEKFRTKLRGESLSIDEQMKDAVEREIEKRERSESRKLNERERRETRKLLEKEADAVAFNLFWVSNQIESSNSRYSDAGKFHRLPGGMASLEFWSVMHPQERFEIKVEHSQNWGAFSTWGIEQIERFKNEVGFDDDDKDNKIEFQAAPRDKYWERGPTTELPEKKGKVYTIYAPECYPILTCRSLFEHTREEGGSKKTLLERFSKGGDVIWGDIGADAAVRWLTSKFNKAVPLLEYYNPGKPFERRDFGWGKTWADPLKELLEARLKLNKALEGPKGKERKEGSILGITHQTYHNLKVWAIYAAHGGVAFPDKREPTLNLPGLPGNEQLILGRALRHEKVEYLDMHEGFRIE